MKFYKLQISKFVEYLFLFLVGATATTNALAIYCNGTIASVYKWTYMTSLSIQVLMSDGTRTSWINMPTKSDEAIEQKGSASH
jgi:PPE-repeat protein